MKPNSIYQSVIEILDLYSFEVKIEIILKRWAVKNRFAGSSDRRKIRDLIFDILRQKKSCEYAGGGSSGRNLLIGYLKLNNVDLKGALDGSPHGPGKLTSIERDFNVDLSDLDFIYKLDIPGWLVPIIKRSTGDDFCEIVKILRTRSVTQLRVNLKKISREKAIVLLLKDKISAELNLLCSSALDILGGAPNIMRSSAYINGFVELQDAGSQLMSQLITTNNNDKIDQISPGGKFLAGFGNDSMNFQSLEGAIASRQYSKGKTSYKFGAARSSGDGTIDDGDHQFKRFNLQMQHTSDQTQTDLIFGYQDKFYAWPGAYTGFAIYPETDHTKTLLALVNHKKQLSNGWWEMAGFYRRLRDDYDYDRKTKESGLPGSFDHETRVYGASIHARINAKEVTWRFSSQLSADELVYSTDLTHGKFYSRSYLKTSIVPERTFFFGDNLSMRIRGGASFDWSNRDDSKILPLLGITLSKEHENGSKFASLEWSESSQLPGYTALNSRSNGLFGGNPNLGRETSQQLTASIGFSKYNWRYLLTGFYREDDDTVDWTYYSGAPYSRQANAVDLEVSGIETSITSQWEYGELVFSYAHIDKDSDYRQSNIDASYYALNFPKHRLVLSSKTKIGQFMEVRLDAEYREQERNILRKGSSEAFFLSAGLQWKPLTNKNVVFGLTADNITDETFERFPGTPALGRQLSANFSYAW